MKNKLIFFDAVGTLIYPDPPVIDTYKEIGEKFGYDLAAEVVSSRFMHAHKKHFNSDTDCVSNEELEKTRWKNVVDEIFNSESNPELFNELWNHFAKPEHWSIYEDTSALLLKLHKQGYYVGVASNFDNRLINIFHKHFPYLDTKNIFYSSQLGYSKPNLKFYETIVKKINNEKNIFYMVGDDETNDIKAAKKAGWVAIHKNEINKLHTELA